MAGLWGNCVKIRRAYFRVAGSLSSSASLRFATEHLSPEGASFGFDADPGDRGVRPVGAQPLRGRADSDPPAILREAGWRASPPDHRGWLQRDAVPDRLRGDPEAERRDRRRGRRAG